MAAVRSALDARVARVLFGTLAAIAALDAWAQAPPEVGSTLRFDPDRATLRWDGVAGAAAYDVYRGALGNGSDLACLVFRTADPSAADPDTPAPLFTYLVAAWNPDGEGPLGDASDGAPRAPVVRCADDDGDLVRDDRDNCPGAANPSQADQNADGLGDACDPRTYTFDGDLPGQRPADMTQYGAVNAGFAVRDVAGDLAVSYDGSGQGCLDAFDRLPQDGPQQGQVVYLDTTALAGQFEINLWNEGSYAENAGGGVLFRVDSTGMAAAWVRRGREFTALGQASTGGATRLRLRLAKEAGTRSTLRLDRWNGAGWDEGAGIFTIVDDRRLFGRGLGLSDRVDGRRPLLRVTAEKTLPAAALAIFRTHDGLDDWKLFQRGPDGHAPLPVPVSWRAPAAAQLEVRVVESANGAPLPGFDWADHVFPLSAAPAGATASFAVDAVPAGGNYDLEARLVDAATEQVLGTDTVAEIAVGDVFLAIGQSNMAGYSGTLDAAEPPIDRVHLFGNDYAWKRAREPMDDGTDQVDRVSEEFPAHSPMLRFAKEIEKAVGVPVAIIPGPLTVTSLFRQWQRNAADPANRGTLYGSAIARVLAQGYAHPVRGVIWYQGESDAGRGTDLYLADLRALVANLRADLGSPNLYFGSCQLATYLYSDFETWLPIQEAQRRHGLDPLAGVIPVIDQPRADPGHLSVEGYKTVGVRLARMVRAGSYGQPVVAVPRLVSARFTSGARTQIEITWDRSVTGGIPGLFRAHDGATPVQPLALSGSGATITLSFASPLPSNATISYGYSRNPGAAWVGGADGSGPVLAFYKVAVGTP